MLNQVAAEALYSATYLEDYLDSVENLPNDLQRHLSRLRELDVGYQAILRDLDHFELQLLKGSDGERDETSMASENGGTEAGNNSSSSANFRKRIMQKLQTALLSSMEIGDEKIQVVQALQDVVENKTRQLETDSKNLEFGREQENAEPVKETIVKEVSNTQTGERQSKRVRRSKVEPNNDSQDGSTSLPAAAAPAATTAVAAATTPLAETKTAHRKTSSASGSGVTGSVGKKKKRKAKAEKERSSSPPDFPIDPDEPTYCLCDQVSYGEMIGCDNDLCPIEWFHFSCVSLTTKPKGKWYCPKCRGDRPTVMKPKAQFLKELERYNREREEKA